MSKSIYSSLLIGATLGALGSWALFSSHGLNSNASQVRQGGFTYINPLLECEIGEERISREVQPFKDIIIDKVESFKAAGRANFISVYYRDLNNGPWFGVNEKEEFILASLVKVPIMISYFREAEEEPSVLDKMIEFKGSVNPSIPHFKPEKSLEVNKQYSVRELLERMVIYSDNDARDLLVIHAEKNQLNRTFNDLGVNLPPDRFMLTVKAYASFFRILFNASYVSQDHSEEALAILAKARFKQGIDAGVPDSIAIAHKFGERWNQNERNEKQLHDCGIVYFPNHPYLLCVMTRGESFENLSSVLGEISATVYKEVDRQF